MGAHVRRKNQAGFSLIELMAVVVIIGVLSVIAVVGYRRYVTSSRMAEATQIVGDIRAAQERRKQETGSYANISNAISPASAYPAANPGEFATAWGAKCSSTACVANTDWTLLPVRPNGPVVFGYTTLAGSGGTSTPASAGVTVVMGGTTVNWVSVNGGVAITNPWYVVGAFDDWNHNGVYATVIGDSFTNQLMTANEGE
jgi:prepilin-type N-terminal cleavage/methylation domain-containing protein